MTPERYRKRPVEIEAVHLTAENDVAVNDWIIRNGGSCTVWPRQINIYTLEGTMTANHGDYVIRGVKGEFYPYKPDIFSATYERAG